MKTFCRIIVPILLVVAMLDVKAQAPIACFSAASAQAFPVTQCGPFFLPLNNCSTGTYDSAVWRMQISSSLSCSGPYGLTFVTIKAGSLSHTNTGYSLTVAGSYKVCLTIYNRQTGAKDSTCACVAISYPFPVLDFVASDTFNCGNLITNFTPLISSGTMPYGPINWFFGDNVTATTPTASNISHSYACKNTTPPCYTITMSATDAHGCSKVITKPCYINVPCPPSPSINVSTGNLCIAPSTLNLSVSATPLIGSGIYKIWFPPLNTPPAAPAIGPTRNTNFSHTFNNFGCYDFIVEVQDSLTGCKGLDTVKNAVCLQTILVDSFVATLNKICCGQSFSILLRTHNNPNTVANCIGSATLIATPVGGGASINLGTINSNNYNGFSFPCTNSAVPIVYNVCIQSGLISSSCGGCTTTFNGCFQITVYPSPNAIITQNVTDTVHCSTNHDFCFQAFPFSANVGCLYSWYSSGLSGVPFSNSNTGCVSFPNFGRQTIDLKICQTTANGGCCSFSTLNISQSKPFGDVSITQTLQSCGSTCATISVLTTVTDTLYPLADSAYIYIFGDGTAPFYSTLPTVLHCYTSSVDTCFTVKVIHIPHSMGGFICPDTIVKKSAVSIGHLVSTNITYTPAMQCINKREACFSIMPSADKTKIGTGICNTSCSFVFSQHGTTISSAASKSCDTTILCVSDVGVFDARYSINNNGCIDTSYFVPNAVTIKGIIGNLTLNYSCNYTNGFCLQILPKINVFPAPNAPNKIKIIINQGACGPPVIYNYLLAVGVQPPVINHCFCNTGLYKITMISSNDSLGCPPDSVSVFANPIAFKAKLELKPANTNHSQCNNKNWCFTSEHSKPGRPYNYDIMWDYGDGKKDTMRAGSADTSLVRPCHHYDSCGRFIVKLKLVGSCIDSVMDTIYIKEIVPGIYHTPLSPTCALCLVMHNNTVFCGDAPDSTVINYGNGIVRTYKGYWSTDTICYNITTTNNIHYDIYSLGGCSSSGYITLPVINGLEACTVPMPDTLICQNKTISFSNCSGGLITNTCWSINTTACAVNNPCNSTSTAGYSYTFSNLGYYYLNLKVSNFYGCVDDTCIRIHVANPVAKFSSRDTISCPGIFDTLTNLSTGAYDKIVVTMKSAAINYFSTFSYSITDPGGLPKKVGIPIGYPGDYIICWKITSVDGCIDSTCKTVHVEGPLGNLSCSNVYGCKGDTICCTLNTNSVLSPIIQYPDGTFDLLNHNSSGIYNFCHEYNIVGHKLVQAIIDDGMGCSYPLSDTVHIDGVTANFTWYPHITDFCEKADVIMGDLSIKGLYALDTMQYKWWLKNNAGIIVSTYNQHQPHIVITIPGTYTMMLAMKSIFGCADTIELPFVKIHPKPVSQFISSPDTICINECVSFTNTSVNFDPVKSYKWYFDWTNTTPSANTINANHCFLIPGNYQVVLLDSSIYNCVDTSIKHLIVVVSGINVDFTQDFDTVCGNIANVHFNSTSSPSIGVTQQWFFGDGSLTPAGSFQHINHTYALPINLPDTCYKVTLIIKSISGCADTLVKQICLAQIPIPKINNGSKTACSPLQTFFTNNTTNLIPIKNYHINFGDASPDYNSNIAPSNFIKTYINTSHLFPIDFYATYTITSNYNCSATIIDTFKVLPNPVACVGNQDSACQGIPTIIGCPPLPNYSYHWFKPAQPNVFKPTPFVPQPTIQIFKLDSFALAVSNQFGCRDTNSITVRMINYVTPDAGRDTTVCIGDTIHLYAHGGISYFWKNLMTGEIVSTQSEISVPVNDSTNYRVFIFGTCNMDSSTIVHLNIFKPKPYITVTPNEAKVFAGQQIKITTNSNALLYKWTPNTNINCDTCRNVIVNPDVNTTYKVVINDLHGCSDSAQVNIKVLCDKDKSLYIPNAFEPKLLAKYENRYFYIQGRGIKELQFLRIYNRWGCEVFSRENMLINIPELGWDGTFNGAPATCDVYMYQMQVLCEDGSLIPISGNFTLVR